MRSEEVPIRKDRHRRDWERDVAPITLAVVCVFLFLVIVLTIVHTVRLIKTNDDLTAIVDLTKTLVWPAALLFIIARFEQPLMTFLNRLSRISIRAGDAEATLETAELKTKVSALLAAQTALSQDIRFDRATTASNPKSSPNAVVASASKLSEIVSEETLSKFSGRQILWVDDRPENNRFLIQAFRELKINVDIALSTSEALNLTDRKRFDVIVSDVGQPGDTRSGYTLLRELSDRGSAIPVILYASSDFEEFRKEAIAAGAVESTNHPQRVFDLVTSILSSKKASMTKRMESVRSAD